MWIYPSMRRLMWMALVALLLLWIATIEREPGGLEALAAQMEAVEQRIGENLARTERPFVVHEDGDTVTEYTSGVLCESNDGGKHLADCQPLIDPGLDGY